VTGNPESFTPPSTPYFDDVPASHPRFRYVQQLKFLGVTTGCSPTLFCPDDPILNYQAAIFAVRGRQIADTSSNYYGTVSIGSPNDNIVCGRDFQCYPYFPTDMPSSDWRFPFVQKAREYSGTMIQSPECGGTSFCPDATTSR